MATPHYLMTDPAHFEVSYQINPWMDPVLWRADASACARAAAGSDALRHAIEAAGGKVEMIPAEAGLPDLVFPANAATVLDGRALMARFAHPERRGEEAPFLTAFHALRDRGVLHEVAELPPGVIHEGAGDALWDRARGWFWGGHGQRSTLAGLKAHADFFGQEVVALELATPHFYHLDTCMRPLDGGHILYYPPAFTDRALMTLRERVAPDLLIETDRAAAEALCVNAVNLGDTVIMAKAPPSLRTALAARGYRLVEVDLSPFIMSGGAAFCMSLRLDLTSHPQAALAAAE
ncbi:MAG: arginine deiminase-related protein [Phenylobacterium sp.]|jgi:N-dimethylarginine dimethylaminohydrolase|nr:arginine deiminase-related protein [Phenylobacterium sp.]